MKKNNEKLERHAQTIINGVCFEKIGILPKFEYLIGMIQICYIIIQILDIKIKNIDILIMN